jgi:UDP-glucose 4-epimerase
VDDSALNIASGQSVSVNALYTSLTKICSFNRGPRYSAARPGEILESRMDPSKAKNILGWTPEVLLQTGLLRTVNWLREQNSSY